MEVAIEQLKEQLGREGLAEHTIAALIDMGVHSLKVIRHLSKDSIDSLDIEHSQKEAVKSLIDRLYFVSGTVRNRVIESNPSPSVSNQGNDVVIATESAQKFIPKVRMVIGESTNSEICAIKNTIIMKKGPSMEDIQDCITRVLQDEKTTRKRAARDSDEEDAEHSASPAPEQSDQPSSSGRQRNRPRSPGVPRPPAKIRADSLSRRDPAGRACRLMMETWHGKSDVSTEDRTRIVTLMRHNDMVNSDPDVRFLAACLNVAVRWDDEALGGLKDMRLTRPKTRNPCLSLLLLLTVRGVVAMREGKLEEGGNFLEAAGYASDGLAPCTEKLYFLRMLARLKRDVAYAKADREAMAESQGVWTYACDVAQSLDVTSDNCGLVSVVHWQRARLHLGFDPARDPPLTGSPSKQDMDAAAQALQQSRDCLEQLGRRPEEDFFFAITTAAMHTRRGQLTQATRWLRLAEQTEVGPKDAARRVQRLRTVVDQLSEGATPDEGGS